MKILGIETSCDETAIAVVEINDGRGLTQKNTRIDAENFKIKVLSNVVSSQIALHAKYGGVVPSLAAREHVKNIKHVFRHALNPVRSLAHAKGASPKDLGEATSNGMKEAMKSIDLIAVTRGPGLGPALLVGLTFAKTISWLYNKPLIGVNHLEGHIYSNWLQPITEISKSEFLISKNIFPALNLIVSGGHTELVLMKNHGQYKIVGETVDDAVGEAFDKVARLLGLGYPGGPQIARHAEQFARNYAEQTQTNAENISVNPRTNQRKSALGEFPRPMINSKNFNFSYSGLKTSVLYKVKDLEKLNIKLTPAIVNEICYEFQKAAVDVLIQKTMRAAKEYKVKSILLSGGVSANSLLRFDLNKAATEAGIKYFQPPMEYTTDNAAMIAIVGYFTYLKNNPALFKKGGASKTDYKSVRMDANLGF